MRGSPDTRRATAAHLAYTSLFERLVPFAGPGTLAAPYGALVSVSGASGSVGVTAPPTNVPSFRDVKDAFNFGVVNADGAHAIVVGTVDSTNINGSSSPIILPASPGASALLFWSNQLGEWVALLGAGGAGAIPPIISQTVLGGGGGVNPIPTGPAATVTSLTVTTTEVTQHVHMVFDCEVDTETAAAGTTVTLTKRLDGAIVDTRNFTAVGTNSYIIGFECLFTGLSVGAHTIDVQALCNNAVTAGIIAGQARMTTILLPG